MGTTRYGDFQSRLPVSHSVLSSRLRSLSDDGLLEPRLYQTNPPRSEYLTTARSRSLWPMLVSIWSWEGLWVPEHTGDLPRMHHTVCDEDFVPRVTCRSCREPVSDKDVVAQWGPSGSWARSMPTAGTRRRSASSQAGLFPQTMTVLGNRWAFAILVAAFVGMSRFTDFQTSARRTAGIHRRPAVDLHCQRSPGRRRQPVSTDREGPRLVPRADNGAAVGSAVVPRARRSRGGADAYGLRQALHRSDDLRPMHTAAARSGDLGGLAPSRQSSREKAICQQFHSGTLGV